MANANYHAVRYGANGHFFFLETDNLDHIFCGNDQFGDPAQGEGKTCDYIDIPRPDVSWRFCAKNDGDCDTGDTAKPHLVRYGDGSGWIVRVASGVVNCGRYFRRAPLGVDLNYIISRSKFYCEVSTTPYDEIVPNGVFAGGCAEGSDCKASPGIDPVLIRYGAGNAWTYRIATLDKYKCNTDTFSDDPADGKIKFCQTVDLNPSISAVAGRWQLVASCGSCSNLSKQVSAGVTGTHGTQASNTWTTAVSYKYARKFKLGELSDSNHEITITNSYARSESVTDSLARTSTEQVGVQCPGGEHASMWQWVIDVDDLCWAQKGACRTNVTTLNILCVMNPPTGNYHPVCAPGTFDDKLGLSCK